MNKISRYLGLTLILGAQLLFSAFTPLKSFTPPQKLADLNLAEVARGKEALDNIAKLHGRKIDLRDGLVAHYQGGNSDAMLWIGEGKDAGQAQKLLAGMVAGIAKGRGQFSPARDLKFGNRTIYATKGLGKSHYFYAVDQVIVWLQIDAASEVKGLHDVLKIFK